MIINVWHVNMTFRYNNVYINEVSTTTGPYESKGSLSKYFDKSYKDSEVTLSVLK